MSFATIEISDVVAKLVLSPEFETEQLSISK